MGAGAAAISTPYWHARELLNDRRGKLFPFGDSDALAAVLTEVLGDPQELQRLRQEAYAHTRPMLWSRVGQQYVALGADLLREERRPAPRAAPLAASTLPELRLDHLRRMTDDTGVIQHATFTVPCRPSGYCVDDNARALVVALRASRLEVDGDAQALVTTYLSFLHACQRDSGDFDNLTSYARVVQRGSHSEDCLGRAMWALGATVALAEREGERKLAREMFLRALPRTIGLGPRGTALTLLGFTAWLAVDDTAVVRTALRARADNLVARFDAESSAAWRWFEPQLTYDNAMLPLALFGAHAATADERYLRIARESLDFLESTCFEGERLVVVGNLGWHARGAQKARADEQAIDASAFVLAFRAAFAATGEPRYLQRMHQSFSWFLGSNRLETPVYDFITAGCRDGLGASEVNRNQGAESTICFLTALLEVMDVADEGPPLRRDRATKGSN